MASMSIEEEPMTVEEIAMAYGMSPEVVQEAILYLPGSDPCWMEFTSS